MSDGLRLSDDLTDLERLRDFLTEISDVLPNRHQQHRARVLARNLDAEIRELVEEEWCGIVFWLDADSSVDDEDVE